MTIPLNTSPVSIHVYLSGSSLAVTCNGQTVPIADSSIHVTVPQISDSAVFIVEFIDEAPDATVDVSHLDATGQHVWPGNNPRTYTFGVTGGEIDVHVEAASRSSSGTRILPIKVKPQAERPWH
jgi:hypothetical protein